MNNLINQAVDLAVKISSETEHDVFLDVSGHVMIVFCRVYLDGFVSGPADYNQAAKFYNEERLEGIVGTLQAIYDGKSELVSKADPTYKAMAQSLQHSQH